MKCMFTILRNITKRMYTWVYEKKVTMDLSLPLLLIDTVHRASVKLVYKYTRNNSNDTNKKIVNLNLSWLQINHNFMAFLKV